MGLWSLLKKDYERHEHTLREPGVWTLANYRVGRVLKQLPGPLKTAGDAAYALSSLAVEIACGSIVSRDVELGQATHFIHALNLRIAPGVKIGDRVGLMHEVTIGPARGKEGLPEIGDDVFIGVGADIRGPIKIGKGAIIGAKAVVTEDVADGVFVIGIPAKKMGWPTVAKDDRGASKK